MSESTLKVKLLCHTPDPEYTVALAARTCYSDCTIDSMDEDVEPRKEKILERILTSGHHSPLEHASFTFAVEGVSRALLAQITRHRIASFSVQSQRYVATEEGMDYIVPPSIARLGTDAEKEFEHQMSHIHSLYCGWMKRGIPAEDARFLLPNAASTRIVFTMNARELRHFLALRCCNRAQWEIRQLAWAMLGILRKRAPILFGDAGAGCLTGTCPEGKHSCGMLIAARLLNTALNERIEIYGMTDEGIVEWVVRHIGRNEEIRHGN